MVLLESLSIKTGTVMPSFTLTDPNNKTYSIEDVMGPNGLWVIFTCNHCPYAIAIWNRTILTSHSLKRKGIHTVAINPNINPDYPEDSVEAMQEKIISDNIPFPYLVDEDQQVAKAYQAQCTPDLYLLKHDQRLFYHGRFDDNWQNEDAVTRHDLQEAANALIENKPTPRPSYPSMGCSIKWLNSNH